MTENVDATLDQTGSDENDDADHGDASNANSADHADNTTDTAPGSTDDVNDVNEAVEPVEFLVQLAERGKIEPWDIDIVDVTDTFLAALDASDLRAGGRALFYASVLLRMKSDALMQEDPPEEENVDEWEEQWNAQREQAAEQMDGTDPFDTLEQEMERRLDRKRARGMPRTLDELVRELREREQDSRWKESRTYDTSDSPHGFTRGTQTLDYRSGDDLRMDDEPNETDVTGTAHTEDIETTIQHVYRALREQYDRDRDEVLYAEIEVAGGSRVETFLALLFLAHRGQVRLQQDELFGDLWVQNPATISATGEAIAD
jgi:segregation and condensation protein A